MGEMMNGNGELGPTAVHCEAQWYVHGFSNVALTIYRYSLPSLEYICDAVIDHLDISRKVHCLKS